MMTKEEFIEQCCLALQVDPGTLDKESSPDNVEMWDSMGWLSLIAMIDEKLGVTLDTDSLKELKKIGDFISMFEKQNLIE
jgi:acyl carrier protein